LMPVGAVIALAGRDRRMSEQGRRLRGFVDRHDILMGPALWMLRIWRVFVSRATRRRRIQEYVSRNQVRELQIGSGPNFLEGWLNTDIKPDSREVYLDATKPFPFPDDSFDFIFTEHMIEHIPFLDGLRMLKECFRVLKSSGPIRIATPDLQCVFDLYKDDKSALQKEYIEFISRNYLSDCPGSSDTLVINNFFHGYGHQIIYDYKTISYLLTASGFVGIEKEDVGSSSFEQLRGIESHGRAVGDPFNKLETLVVEAHKP
jgi:predicted SAM-dependent methyltransferase